MTALIRTDFFTSSDRETMFSKFHNNIMGDSLQEEVKEAGVEDRLLRNMVHEQTAKVNGRVGFTLWLGWTVTRESDFDY